MAAKRWRCYSGLGETVGSAQRHSVADDMPCVSLRTSGRVVVLRCPLNRTPYLRRYRCGHDLSVTGPHFLFLRPQNPLLRMGPVS